MSFSINLFAFCKKDEALDNEISRFVKLMKPFTNVTLHYLKTPAGTFTNKNELMDAEAKILFSKMPVHARIVALSEEGKQPENSASFAEWISKMQQKSMPLVFVIGGAYGLSSTFKKQAHQIMSLSNCTFAHTLAQLVLLEQIYRAFTILQGHPYHK